MLTVLFIVLEPGISGQLSGLRLVVFWLLHIGTALALLEGVQLGLSRLPAIRARSPWFQIVLSGVLGALLFAPIAAALDLAFGVNPDADDAAETWSRSIAEEFFGVVVPVLLVWVALNTSRLLSVQGGSARASDPDEDVPAFWNRVSRDIGRDLVALSAELHYLRVFTTQGDALILYPFGQAVADLAPAQSGIQIHRSHWVALDRVQDVVRQAGSAQAVMETGVTLPISRSRRKAVTDAVTRAKAQS